MEKFYSKATPPSQPPPQKPSAKRKKPNAAAKQGHVTASSRASQYVQGTFYSENGLLYCRTCNEVVEHARKTTVNRHLDGKTHLKKVATSKAAEKDRQLRTQSIATVVHHSSEAALVRKELFVDLCRTFLACNIPMEKIDHPDKRV